jgi:flagellar basal body-associated protein FliL
VIIIIAILLGTLALAFVLYPLYRGAKTKTSPTEPASGELLTPQQSSIQQTDREQAARAALQEVEFDYQLGNLAEDDYRTLRQRYMRRALTALKSRHDRERAIDELIEEQLHQLRKEHEHGPS